MNDSLAENTTENQPSSPPPSSIWARMFNVFAAPGEVFAEVKSSPPCTANWLLPAILSVVIGLIGTWLVFSQDTINQELRDQQAKAIQEQVDSGKMAQAQADQAMAVIEKYAGMGTKIAAGFAVLIGSFASPFWWGLIIWLVGAKAFKGELTFMKAVETAGLANMINVLAAVVKSLLIITMGSLFAGANLGMLVGEFDPTNTLHGVLAAIDLLVFWGLAVKAIGLAKLSGASFGKAAFWLFGLWIVITGLMIGFGVLMQKLFAG